ncbi:MAG: class I SAM-dependent methyltransferase [Acetobacteraceae bacterium]|nr:class I SAM-dependent methyltransferase [Acetobacteraceae bacterium]
MLQCHLPAAAQATPVPVIDLAALKARQQATWSAGDFAVIGTTLQLAGEQLCEAVDLRAGERVLDVAAGNGNATLAAARRFAEVTSTDYVPALLERGRARATAEGLPVAFQVADAEDLPFENGQFDVVLSTYGVMFTADHLRVAREMLRVCRPGGRIGMANWTPEGLIGQLFKVIGRHLPPPPGAPSPAVWGTRPGLEALFCDGADGIASTERCFVFRYRSPAHWLEVFRTWYGPVLKAFAALDTNGQAALEGDILDLLGRFNRATDGTLVAPAAYLEVVVTRAA